MLRIGTALLVCAGLAGCNSAVLWSAPQGSPTPRDGATLSYFLPQGITTVTAAYTADTRLLVITVEPQIRAVPDFAFPLSLAYSHNALSSDEVDVLIKNGLLTSVSSKTEDKTVEALQGVNLLLQQIAAVQAALAPPPETSPSAAAAAVPTLAVGVPDAKPCTNLKTSMTVNVTYQRADEPVVQQASAGCRLFLHVTVSQIGVPLDVGAYPDPGETSENTVCRQAVCFRLAGGFRLDVVASVSPIPAGLDGALTQKSSVELLAPLADRGGFVRFNRRAFVANSTTIAFDNGMLSQFKSTDPSEIVGFLKLPLEILKAVPLVVAIE